MRFVLFYHSILSDWNHGNAHFLRGIVAELQARGHEVAVYEARDAWSLQNLLREHGPQPLQELAAVYPRLPVIRYDPQSLDVAEATHGADVVIVHEWSDPGLVARLGQQRARTRGFRLFFHDTHHRSVSAPDEMRAYDLSHYDGALVFGEAVREVYARNAWVERAWTWHEAADTRVFHPLPAATREGDVVWVGNWGDDERTAELATFLMKPVHELGLRGSVYGVRYPDEGLAALRRSGLGYRGWLANHRVPGVFARYRATVHVPRRWYVERLPGIPTIRPFEALACGIPLVSGPWEDSEGIFREGTDYLQARDEAQMRRCLRDVLHDGELAASLAAHGLERIRKRHTCAHRVDELLSIVRRMQTPRAASAPPAPAGRAPLPISAVRQGGLG